VKVGNKEINIENNGGHKFKLLGLSVDSNEASSKSIL